jgi:hypothetical protein
MSRRLRFEVFKRDCFTCQYCGRKSPEVILQVDHIDPVAEGGSDDIVNLTTSCVDCNGGKGAVRLSENVSVERKRVQLEMLQERREQMRMIAEWQEELSHIEDEEVDLIISRMDTSKFGPNALGRELIKKWVKLYGFEDVLITSGETFAKYYKETQETWAEAFDRIPRTIKWKRLEKSDPEKAKYLYVRGILRNRCNYINHGQLDEIIAAWSSWGFTAAQLQTLALKIYNWTQFKAEISEILDPLVEAQNKERA